MVSMHNGILPLTSLCTLFMGGAAWTLLGLHWTNSVRIQGVTLKELSQQLGVSRNTITNWKANGKPPRREDTKKLAKLLYLNEEETDLLLTSAGYAPEYRTRGTGNLLSSGSDTIKVEQMIVQRLLLSEGSDQKLVHCG